MKIHIIILHVFFFTFAFSQYIMEIYPSQECLQVIYCPEGLHNNLGNDSIAMVYRSLHK